MPTLLNRREPNWLVPLAKSKERENGQDDDDKADEIDDTVHLRAPFGESDGKLLFNCAVLRRFLSSGLHPAGVVQVTGRALRSSNSARGAGRLAGLSRRCEASAAYQRNIVWGGRNETLR